MRHHRLETREEALGVAALPSLPPPKQSQSRKMGWIPEDHHPTCRSAQRARSISEGEPGA